MKNGKTEKEIRADLQRLYSLRRRARLRKWLLRISKRYAESVRTGASAAVIAVSIVGVVMALAGHDEYLTPVLALLLAALAGSAVVFIGTAPHYFHDHDSDLIEERFIGFSRKCRIFCDSLEELFSGSINAALRGFLSIENDLSDKTTDMEKAVNAYYLGRCYYLLGYLPNALRYFELSSKRGLTHPAARYMTAKVTGAMGEIENAKEMLMVILDDKDDPFSNYVRYEIGNIYLRNNDPETAMKWYEESMKRHEHVKSVAVAASLACLMMHDISRAEEMKRLALVNGIPDASKYIAVFNHMKDSVLNDRVELNRLAGFGAPSEMPSSLSGKTTDSKRTEGGDKND